MRNSLTLIPAALLLAFPLAAQMDCQQPDHHHSGVMRRGAMGMGFDQQKTTHHFILLESGGRIEVTAKDAADRED
ncbi:MAG TPA: hypothetical protein VKH35_03885, partial [Thermoanaerobaculia bacterium]|nr:hypothetical protein [Thermoanaerobaculia bacterium]